MLNIQCQVLVLLQVYQVIIVITKYQVTKFTVLLQGYQDPLIQVIYISLLRDLPVSNQHKITKNYQ